MRTHCLLIFVSLFSLTLSAQDIEAILAVQEIDTMLYSGPKDNRINWVIQNRGDSFDDKDDFTTLYESDLLKTFELGHELEKPPYAQYRNFFNLYTFWWPDAPDDDSGWSFTTIQGLRDLVFLPWANERTGWATLFSSTKYGGGGGAGLNREARVGDGKMFGMGWETFLHEFGHTMPGLPDEYSASGEWSNGQCWESGNTTGELNVEEIPWRRWIAPGTPIPTPYTAEYLDSYGAFEGALTNYFGCHRPSARNCIMGAGGFGEDYGRGLCSPCVQRTICFLYKYVNVIENPQPAAGDLAVNGTETLTFSVNVVKPEPNTQQYTWLLNGEVIATNTETVDVTFDACATYELVFAVRDNNDLVRYDPKFEDIYPEPYQELKWTINQTEVESYPLAASEEIVAADCSGMPNGGVSFGFTGGQAPYQVYLAGELQQNPVMDLAAGSYDFAIVDASGCGIVRTIEIPAETLFAPEICTTYTNGEWNLSVEDTNYHNEDLQFNWSTGENTPAITGLPAGNYAVTVTTPTGCTQVSSIDLLPTSAALEVVAIAFPSGLERATGRIYLDITGGQAPYTIDWYDKPNQDITSTNVDQIISSGTTWGHEPEFAFDNQANEKWLHAVTTGAYIGYRPTEATVVNYYTITSADDVPARDPKDWQLQGSMNGVDWAILDQQNDQLFTSRFQQRGFLTGNTVAYTYYRLFIQANQGDIATQLGEVEFIGADAALDFVRNERVQGEQARTDLAAGNYRYIVKDANQTVYEGAILVGYSEPFTALDLQVVQDGDCQVRIENPTAEHDYYWFKDLNTLELLHRGTTFQPSLSGNYYVAAVHIDSRVMSENIQGFAVRVQTTPEVVAISETEIGIVDPASDLLYHWYDQENCGTPLHTGPNFAPQAAGNYYVSAQWPTDDTELLDPADIPGLIIRMDAADLDGDGVVDNPQRPTSSLYGWGFTNGNSWADGNWFAYRSNWQNGLGVADFATIWLQRIAAGETAYQTILMAYEENPISFPERAPFEGLTENIPRHSDATQLYSNNAPARTLNGQTYLNGDLVDPLTTANPLEFCVLGTVMTEPAFNEVYYTDTHWEGKIGELLLYNRALTPEEMRGASAFLNRKWISTADLESPRLSLYWDGMVLDEEDEPINTKLKAYPNPASNVLHLTGIESGAVIQLLDQRGIVVQSVISASDQLELDIAYLPAGIYYAKIQGPSREGSSVFRLVKL